MNLPNRLTLSRIFMIPFFVALLHTHFLTDDQVTVAISRWLALGVFLAAAITDYLDGAIARKHNIVTNFGKLFDPLADKLLTMSAFVAFVEIHDPAGHPVFPAWAVILVLAREYLVTGLRSVAVSNGTVIHADNWGKQKTIWQLIGIITILAGFCLRDTLIAFDLNPRPWLDPILPWVFRAMLSIIVFLTVLSGLLFLIKNWSIVSDRERP